MIAGAIIVVALVIIGLGLKNYIKGPIFTTPGPATFVSINGMVRSTGNETNVTEIIFTSNTDIPYPEVSVTKGNYLANLLLPNQNATYTISAKWQGNYTWQHGTVDNYSKLVITRNNSSSINIPANTYTFETPDSEIKVNGKVSTGVFGSGLGATAKIINYSAPGFAKRQTTVDFYGNYNLILPNMAVYNVSIIYSAGNNVTQFFKGNFSGYYKCAAGTDNVNESAGMSRPPESWMCISQGVKYGS